MLEVDDPEKAQASTRRDSPAKIIGAAFEVIMISSAMDFRARLPTRTASGSCFAAAQQQNWRSVFRCTTKEPLWAITISMFWSTAASLSRVKVAPQYDKRDEAQLLNELKATGLKVGLLINFGRTKVEYKRLVF